MKNNSPFSALQFRNFRLLWIGLLISAIGSQMQIVAIHWHIYELTHSPISLGIIGLARFLPLMIFSPISGSIADMHNRKRIMFISQSLMAFFSFLLAFFTYTHITTPFIIYVILIALASTACFDMPARQSLTPHLVPKKHLMNAVGLNTLLWQTSIVLGPSISGFVIAATGIWSVYFINAISFIAVIISLLLMSPIHHKTHEASSPFNLSFMKEGLLFVKNSPMIFSTMILDFFATLFASSNTLMPIFAKDIFQVGPKGLGFLYAAPAMGGILAGLLMTTFGKHIKKQGKILIYGIILYGGGTILFGLSKSFMLSLLFLGIAGAGDMISTILRNTIRQLITPDRLRGRMVAINMLFHSGGPQLGEVEAGIVASLVGAPLSVVFGGIGTLASVFAITKFTPQLKTYESDQKSISR